MKIRKLTAWLVILIICLSLSGCYDKKQPMDSDDLAIPEPEDVKDPAAEDSDDSAILVPEGVDDTGLPDTGNATPLLYKVTDDDGDIIWLFGSIHIGRDDYYPLPDYVMDAFDSSDSLAVEADIVAFEKNLFQQANAIKGLMYKDGSSIEDHIPEKLYKDAVAALKEFDYYLSPLDMFLPVFWSSAIELLLYEELGGDPELGIDDYFINRAYDVDKEVLEVESVEFQYEMLADFSDELQIMLLETSVEAYNDKETAKKDLDKLMDLWAAGNEDAFAEYLAEEDDDLDADEAKLYEEYNDAMITKRNLSMADYAEDALESGDELFICVGAAHIVGEGAVADLLKDRGYTVELVA